MINSLYSQQNAGLKLNIEFLKAMHLAYSVSSHVLIIFHSILIQSLHLLYIQIYWYNNFVESSISIFTIMNK
jgi:hypothetical protein